MSLSVFFSIHYLTAYYLLQPYSAGTEMKSVAYQLVMSATYFVCLFLMQLKLPHDLVRRVVHRVLRAVLGRCLPFGVPPCPAHFPPSRVKGEKCSRRRKN